jgi:serine/threonine-protein kinase
LYLAMELLSGETLEDRLTREPNQRLALMRWIASALAPLAAAHAQGIVHRDLKPANLFIARAADGSEQLKLLDFGLARDTRQKSRTETGVALGTPYYMSPEQAIRPKEVGPPSDVWALGVMMYEVLSGHMPFDGETLHAVVLQSTTRPHVPLATRRPELDHALCDLVEECLCKEPEMRPHDASALLARLLPLIEDEHIRRQLDVPISRPNLGHSSRASTDQISYADTAITLPAPRLDESESSYSPRRRARTGAFVPLALSTLLLGGGAFGYFKYIPTSHTNTAAAAPESPAAFAPATNPSPSPSPSPSPLTAAKAELEAVPSLAPAAPLEHTESQASPARDARAQAAATKLPTPAKRPNTRTRRQSAGLPQASAVATETTNVEAAADLNADAPSEPLPAAPIQDAPWDEVDTQRPSAPSTAEPSPQLPAAEPSPAIGPEGSAEAPAEPAREVESLPPPEPPASP